MQSAEGLMESLSLRLREMREEVTFVRNREDLYRDTISALRHEIRRLSEERDALRIRLRLYETD